VRNESSIRTAVSLRRGSVEESACCFCLSNNAVVCESARPRVEAV